MCYYTAEVTEELNIRYIYYVFRLSQIVTRFAVLDSMQMLSVSVVGKKW